jgi:hypothetical protein
MDNQNNPDSYREQKGWRTREQKEKIILLWKQSGKSRKEFCQDQGISYNSLVGWCKQFRDLVQSSGFTEIKVNDTTQEGLFARLHLPDGITIDLYQSVPAHYFLSLIRK